MHKQNCTFPIITSRFHAHDNLKQPLLEALDRAVGEHLQGYTDDISKCDWETGRFDYEREWVKLFQPDLFEHLHKWLAEIKYDTFNIGEIWFQQYANGGRHAWHTHSANFTNVYYLDLPEDSPKTEWIDPVTQEHNEFNVQEGDIITFPSWIKHRSTTNLSKGTKTIISWNMDIAISDRYGEDNGYN